MIKKEDKISIGYPCCQGQRRRVSSVKQNISLSNFSHGAHCRGRRKNYSRGFFQGTWFLQAEILSNPLAKDVCVAIIGMIGSCLSDHIM